MMRTAGYTQIAPPLRRHNHHPGEAFAFFLGSPTHA